MSIAQINAIEAKLRSKNLNAMQLAHLAREVPLLPDTSEHAAVGAALEHVLREKYQPVFETQSTTRLTSMIASRSSWYEDRVDRAQRETITTVLEHRYPNTPDPIDTYNDETGLTYGQHVAAVYLAAAQ